MVFKCSFTYIVAILVVACCTLLSSMSTIVVVMGQQEEYSEESLQTMSKEQLEDICIQRGFELLKDEVDPSTGELYQLSHQDYVDAAMKCLAIEQEMNELLTQYPELAEELEEEIRKMETENAAKQAELQEMQHQLSSSTNPQDVKDNADDGSPEQSAMTFVSKTNTTVDGKDSSTSNASYNDNSPDDPSDFTISEEVVIDDADFDEVDFEDEGVQDEKDDQGSQTNTSATLSDVASPAGGPSSSKEDYTLSHLAIESLRAFVKHAKDDLKRIIELVVPVMRPLLTAGDVAWRQIKALFVMVRDTSYESSSKQIDSDKSATSSEEQQVEKAATKTEECDDVVT